MSSLHSPRAVPRLLAPAICVIATLIWYFSAVRAVEGDGQFLLEILADPEGGFPVWYQAAILPFAELVELFVGRGREFDTLTWTSAIGGGVGLALLVETCRREGGVRGTWLALLVVAGAPAMWLYSTTVEVHSLQMAGAGLVGWIGSLMRPRRLAVAAVALFAAQLLATTLHNSNALVAGGAVWLASRRAGEPLAFEWRRGIVLAVTALSAALLGLWIDHGVVGVAGVRGGTDFHTLLNNFSSPFSLGYYAREFAQGWGPVLVFALLFAPRDRRELATLVPFLSAAVPQAVVFGALLIESRGGYYGPAMWWLAVGTAAVMNVSTRPLLPVTERWRTAAVVLAAVGGVVVGVRDVHAPERHALAELGEQRLAIARAALPDGGLFISLDPMLQVVHGRSPDVWELEITMAAARYVELELDVTPNLDELERYIEEARTRGDTLALNETPRELAPHVPRLGEYHALLVERIERHYELSPTTVMGYAFSIGRPRLAIGTD